MPTTSTPSPPHERNRKGIRYTVIGSVIIIFLGIFVTVSYRQKLEYEQKHPRLPRIRPLRENIVLTNRDGSQVELKTLKEQGDVWIAALVHTKCPQHCDKLMEVAKTAEEKFGGNPRFRQVFIAVDPKTDTPEALSQWAEDHGAAEDWWFLTGDKDLIEDYIVEQFQFSYIMKRTPEKAEPATGLLFHDTRIALVDPLGDIRGYYDISDPKFAEQIIKQLYQDIQTLLDQADKAEATP